MIRSFYCKKTESLFNDIDILKFRSFERVARRKLMYLNSARVLQDLKVPPNNRLESLKGNKKGKYSIRINDQWRICFSWKDNDSYNVEIVDYH